MKSRLLSGFLLILMLGAGFRAGLWLLVAHPGAIAPAVVTVIIAQVGFFGSYALNRHGYYRGGIYSFIGFQLVIIPIGTLFTDDSTWVFYTSVVVVASAIFASPRVMLVVFLGALTETVVLSALRPVFPPANGLISLAPLLGVTGFSLTLISYRLEMSAARHLATQQIEMLEWQLAQAREAETAQARRVQEYADQLQKAQQQAERAQRRADKAERAKGSFLAGASHELHAPLNAVLNHSELVALGMLGPVNMAQSNALEKAIQGGRHLLMLIDDVLDMAKLESGAMALHFENDVNLRLELDSVITATRALLQEKGAPVRFVLDIDANLPRLSIDRRRMQQILMNLLSNAVKFTDSGTITLSVKAKSTEVWFVVCDTGPGIHADMAESLYEPFQNIARSPQNPRGTGLGLPITKRLVEAHGGRMWYDSSSDGGANFFVALPINGGARRPVA